ncbi:MAG TPA: two-component regulator propeller domain-containing protein, partial [Chitinophagaceae bacterium]
MTLGKLYVTITAFMFLAQSATVLKAQEINENNFALYTRQQGLSHNNVLSISQDSTGYLWVATSFGLNRFNGNNFLQFHSSRDSSSLPTEYISNLVWLNRHDLAAFTTNGLYVTDTRNGETRNLLVPYDDKQYQYKFNNILAVKANSAGDIFIVTRSGFYHFDEHYHLLFRYDYYTRDQVARTPFAFGRNLLSIDDHNFLVVTSVGLYHYNCESKKFKRMTEADCPQISAFINYPGTEYEFYQQKPGCFLIMAPDSNRLIYADIANNKITSTHIPFQSARNEFDYRSVLVSVNDTLMYLTGNVSGFYKLTLDPVTRNIQFHPKKYFAFYTCSYLFEDRDNNLWIATNKGLLRQGSSQSMIRQIAVPSFIQDSFPNAVIDDIYATDKRIYVATRGKSGLLIFNKESFQFLNRLSFENFTRSPNSIYAVESARDTTLFVGTYGPLFSLNMKNNHLTEMSLEKWNKEESWIADLCKARDKNIWVASDNIYKYDAATNKVSVVLNREDVADKIQWAARIREDASGNIWVAGHGLLRYNVGLKKIDRVLDSFPYIRMP